MEYFLQIGWIIPPHVLPKAILSVDDSKTQMKTGCAGFQAGKNCLRVLVSYSWGALLGFACLFTGILHAQVPERPSLAGEAAAAGRHRGEETKYNLRLGPIHLNMAAGLELEYDDNVNLANNRLPGNLGPQEDLFLRPLLNVTASWQVTHINRLSLRLGLAYEFSLNDSRGSQVSPFTLSPDSEIGFDIFIGDVRINLHDRFALQNNPTSQATINNNGNYSLFMNTAGVSILWNLNDVVVSGGYDYIIERYTGGSTQRNDRDGHQLQLAVAFLLNETTTSGIQSSALFSTGGGASAGKQTLLSLGPFLEFQLTPFTRFLLSGGIQQFESQGFSSDAPRNRFGVRETGTQNGGSTSDIGYYWTVAAHNKLNLWYSHSLTAGHERQPGFDANYVDIDYIRYTGSWQANTKIILEFITGFEHYKEAQGFAPESLDRWHVGLGFSYQLRQNLSTRFRYSHYSRDSNIAFRDYQQNVTTIGFAYDF